MDNNQKYKSTMPSNEDLLKIFPEAKEIIPEKIKEWQHVKEVIEIRIKDNRKYFSELTKDEFERWFLNEAFIKYDDGEKLKECDKQLGRLYRLQNLLVGKKTNSMVTDDDIARAKQVPIQDIVDDQIQLKKRGKYYIGRCPFHQESHSSFTIYPKTNTFYCFGACSSGGDVITFVELFYHYSFYEAVKWLIKK